MEYLETGLTFILRPTLEGDTLEVEVVELVAAGTAHEQRQSWSRVNLLREDGTWPTEDLVLGAVHRVAFSVANGERVRFEASALDDLFPLPDPEEQRPLQCCIYCNGVLYCGCAVQTSCGSCCIGFCCGLL